LFNEQPLTVGGFELRARGVVPCAGTTPTSAGWQAAFEFATNAEESSPYWVGDLVVYLDERRDWREQRDQLISVTGLARHTIENRATISRKVKERARDLSPSITHSDAVTKLEPTQQEAWLEKARDEGWTVSEFKKAIKHAEQTTIIEGQAETMHTVDVTVRLSLEAESPHAAEQIAWTLVKQAVALMAHSHVIAAHAAPHLGSVRRPSRVILKSA
jgi:hypothetical protein